MLEAAGNRKNPVLIWQAWFTFEEIVKRICRILDIRSNANRKVRTSCIAFSILSHARTKGICRIPDLRFYANRKSKRALLFSPASKQDLENP